MPSAVGPRPSTRVTEVCTPMPLDLLFRPSSVAVQIGATTDGPHAGRLLAALDGCGAEVFLVGTAPDGVPTFPRLAGDGATVDLLITLLGSGDDIGPGQAVGARAVLELGAPGPRNGSAGLLAAGSAGVADLGTGFVALASGRWPGSRDPRAGSVSLVLEGRLMGEYCLGRAVDRGLGLNKVISVGPAEEGIGAADCIRYLAEDDSTRVIAVAVDEIADLAALGAACDVAGARDKPVVLFVGGELPGEPDHDRRCERSALFRSYLTRHLVHEAASVTDLLNVAYGLAGARRYPDTGRVVLLTGSGGVGVLMADRADAAGLDVAPVPSHVQEQLHELWPLAAVKNPVDTTAQVINNPPLLADFTRTVLRGGNYDGAIIFMTHIGLNKQVTDRRRVPLAEVIKEFPDVFPAVTLLTTPEVQQDFERDGFVVFEDPFDAVTATRAVVDRGTWLRQRDADAAAAPHARADPAQESAGGAHDRAVSLLRSAGVAVADGRVGQPEADGPARPSADLAVEFRRDGAFGTTVRVEIQAVGGTAAAWSDAVCGVGPLTARQADDLVRGLRGFAGLTGARGDEPLDVDAVVRFLVSASGAFDVARSLDHLVVAPLRVSAVGEGVLAEEVRAGGDEP